MARLITADFYYECVLSMLFNNGVIPTLVENSQERRIYNFLTDNGDVISLSSTDPIATKPKNEDTKAGHSY